MTYLKYAVVVASLTLVGFQAQADNDFTESAMLLQQALMESNAEYNKQRKKMNHEEFERADEWSSRESGAITINQRGMSDQEFSEYQNLQGDFNPTDREVTSHDEKKDDKMDN